MCILYIIIISFYIYVISSELGNRIINVFPKNREAKRERERKRDQKQDKQKTNTKMVDLNQIYLYLHKV